MLFLNGDDTAWEGTGPITVTKSRWSWIHRHLSTSGWTFDQIRSLPTVNSGAWCDRQGIQLETLYGNELHQRGATLPDLGLATIPREDLACLRPDEIGAPQYTLEGWLAQIDQSSR